MDIRVCPNCGILFNLDKNLWNMDFGVIDCPCCKKAFTLEEYERYQKSS